MQDDSDRPGRGRSLWVECGIHEPGVNVQSAVKNMLFRMPGARPAAKGLLRLLWWATAQLNRIGRGHAATCTASLSTGSSRPRAPAQPEGIVNVFYMTAYAQCNYSCTYCSAGHGQAHAKGPDRWNPDRYRIIIGNLTRLGFTINVRVGVEGEFFLDKTLVDGARQLTHADNVASVNLITNLSFSYAQYKRLLQDFRQEKVAIIASCHPTEIKDPQAWLETAARMAADYEFAALLVAYPPLLGQIREHRDRLIAHGIETFVQPYIGPEAGKDYPRGYTTEERTLLRDIMYSRHDVEFMLNLKKPGLCNAGFRSLSVNPDGWVFPCGVGRYWSALGNLARGPELRRRSGPKACPFAACPCDTENLNTVSFEQHYERTSSNQHKYRYRLRNEALADPSLDEWNIVC